VTNARRSPAPPNDESMRRVGRNFPESAQQGEGGGEAWAPRRVAVAHFAFVTVREEVGEGEERS